MGQTGVQRVTYRLLSFANEVLRQASSSDGVQPWVRAVYALAHRRYHAYQSSLVDTAAMIFDRMRREWPQTRLVEGDLYHGLDMR